MLLSNVYQQNLLASWLMRHIASKSQLAIKAVFKARKTNMTTNKMGNKDKSNKTHHYDNGKAKSYSGLGKRNFFRQSLKPLSELSPTMESGALFTSPQQKDL